MIESLAKKITNKFINSNTIKFEDREIYYYCFETTIVILLSYSLLFLFFHFRHLEKFVEAIMLIII